MALFRFRGDPNDNGSGRDKTVMEWGEEKYCFFRDIGTNVCDPDLISKLRRHSHFEEQPEPVIKAERRTAAALPEIIPPPFHDLPAAPAVASKGKRKGKRYLSDEERKRRSDHMKEMHRRKRAMANGAGDAEIKAPAL